MTMAKTQPFAAGVDPGAPIDAPRDRAREASVDPLRAPPTSMPQSPLLRDELPPLRPGLLDISPVGRRMENLDALRIVCMAVIIVTHVTGPYLNAVAGPHVAESGLWKQSPAAPDLPPLFRAVFSLNVACRFGVPCFMMISFFIYWHQLYEKGRSWGELLRRRFRRLVPAFVCWSLFYFAVYKVAERITGVNYDRDLLHWLNWKDWHVWVDVFVWGRACYHLYYLPMVMQCLLLIPLLRVLWKRPATAWGWVALTVAVWYWVLYGVRMFQPDTPSWRAAAWTSHAVHEEMAPPLLVFPLVGMMGAGQVAWRKFIARTPDAFWWGVLAAGVALHVAEAQWLLNYSYGQALAFLKLGRLVTGVGCFVLFLRHPLMRDPLPRVSHYAFGLHFMHPFVILMLTFAEARYLAPAVAGWQAYAVPMLAVNLALTFGLTFGLCLLVGRCKRLEFLVV